ncbi:MAG: CCA tRNA nucleotidyltransferase [Candidatus Omnitrophica bacterium]|nr:CCA tRNA nucleotidyltransferase [Candidatus Omnitrophota bacterium]
MLFLKKINELPGPMADFIRFAGRLADEKKINAYVVGGFVRDLFLGIPDYDIDLVVEGDGIAFAEELSSKLSLHVVTHKRFGTATLSGLEGFKVDIATSRKEIYEKPAALPTVSKGLIQDDLFRRDFTINAMAIAINSPCFGKLMDFYGGQDDLKKGLIRALHPLSFIDDPTRILRAVRFEQRFDFKIEKQALVWIKEAVHRRMLHIVQKHRLRDELILIFKEKAPIKPLKRLYALCGLTYIAEGLRFQRHWPNYFHEAAKKIAWYREHFLHKRHIEPYVIYLALFFYPLSLKAAKKAMLDFAFHKGVSSRVVSLKENTLKIKKELSKKNVVPSTVYRLLEPLSYEVILLFEILARHKAISGHIEDFLFIYNGQRLHIKGEDLSRLGLKPGPYFKKVLDDILVAKIDGKVRDREEELGLARKLIHLK